jgi:hypothetical protein
MSQRENLFRPVHKGIRSMIYELGRRLGTTEFTDEAEAKAIAKELKDDLAGSVSGCILCLLRAHSAHEEKDFFGAVRPFDPDVVELMMVEHRDLSRRIHELGKTCDEVLEAAPDGSSSATGSTWRRTTSSRSTLATSTTRKRPSYR